MAAPEKKISLGDADQTWTDNYVGYLNGRPLAQCKDVTRAMGDGNGFGDELFKLDVTTIAASIKAGKGFNPFPHATGLVIKNEPFLTTRRK